MLILNETLNDFFDRLTVDYYVNKPTTALACTGMTCCDRAPVPTGVVCVACRMELLEWPTAVVWNHVLQPSATLALIGAPQMDSWHAFWIPVLVRCVGLSGGGSSK